MLSPAANRRSTMWGRGLALRRTSLSQVAALRRRDVWIPLTYFAIGFTPITSLALALFEFVPLQLSTLYIVLPALLLGVALGVRYPAYGRLALRGYAIGIVAVLLYDATRVPGILSGVWKDFIPNIGALLLQRTEGHALLGYTWRWLGNGAGMGVAFFMVYPLLSRRLTVWVAGPLFGVGVWGCLLATLLLAPMAQTLLFRLTPFTFCFSLFGHLVFGGALAVIMWRTRKNIHPYPPDTAGAAGRRTLAEQLAA